MKHAEPASFAFDLTDGETQAYVADAARFLRNVLGATARLDGHVHVVQGMGEGGQCDLALGLLALLSGDGSDEGNAYTAELLKIAANKIIDADPNLAHAL